MTRRILTIHWVAALVLASACEKAPRDGSARPEVHQLAKDVPPPTVIVPPPRPAKPPKVRDANWEHSVFQAVALSGDTDKILAVLKELGLFDPNNTSGTTERFQEFVNGHSDWAMKNLEFIQTIVDSAKAKAWLAENYP